MSESSAAAALLAEAERRERELRELDAEFRDARVTARSQDRSVAVTVDIRGHVVAVELTGGATRTHPADSLGPLIAELAGRAVSSLQEHYTRRATIAECRS